MLVLYKNPGLFCAQTCMKIVLRYYYPKKKFSLQKLAKLSYKMKNGVTSSVGIVLALDNFELDWSTDGSAAWFGQENTFYYDNDAAQSGAITNTGGACELETNIYDSCGTVKCWVRTNCNDNYLLYLNLFNLPTGFSNAHQTG